MQIAFSNANIDGCWPNHFKSNLNLLDGRGEVVAIIPLEEYPEREKSRQAKATDTQRLDWLLKNLHTAGLEKACGICSRDDIDVAIKDES